MLKPATCVVCISLLVFGTSCHRDSAPNPVVIRVLRDPSFAADLIRSNAQFVKSEPHVHSGRLVNLDTRDDVADWDYSQRIRSFSPNVFIFSSLGSVPTGPGVSSQLGSLEYVCGIHPAYVPVSITGEEREAAEMYVKFVAAQCPDLTPKAETAAGAEPESNEPDPNRPLCTTAACVRIKKFLKEHYCGESPFGNGPEDGCDYKEPVRTGAKVTATFSCNWDEALHKSSCRQFGRPSQQTHEILLRELHRIGLPDQAEGDLAYTVVEASDWTLMSAEYQHVDGADLTLCEVVVAVGGDGQVHVLRTVKLQKANADALEATMWSPLDIADVDGDGTLELVLKGDAYEDHWLEVVRVRGDSVETIFSGLGYYL